MKKEKLEIIKFTTREILLTMTEPFAVLSAGFLHGNKPLVIELRKFLDERQSDRADFSRKIYRLQRRGIIRKFTEGKIQYLEITAKGLQHIQKLTLESKGVKHQQKWDGKWRVVISDIPEKDRAIRDFLRIHLYKLGFRQIQKSVFIFPFECSEEINYLCETSGGRQYVKYLIADIIEGEQDIIEYFLEQDILSEADLKNK